MSNVMIKKSDQVMMSLVHYFVTKENYAPINVQGVKDEIWLENLEGPYRIIRISCNSIINEEQYKFDIFKMKHIMKQIKKKTMSLRMNALNICLDIDFLHQILLNHYSWYYFQVQNCIVMVYSPIFLLLLPNQNYNQIMNTEITCCKLKNQ